MIANVGFDLHRQLRKGLALNRAPRETTLREESPGQNFASLTNSDVTSTSVDLQTPDFAFIVQISSPGPHRALQVHDQLHRLELVPADLILFSHPFQCCEHSRDHGFEPLWRR